MRAFSSLRTLIRGRREHLPFLFRYALVGAGAGVIQILGLYIWVFWFRLEEQYLWGVVISYALALVVTFTLQKFWTFQNRSRELGRQMTWYTAISLGNLGLSAIILQGGKMAIESMGQNFFDIWYLVIQAVAVVICALVSFFLNKHLTFRSSLNT